MYAAIVSFADPIDPAAANASTPYRIIAAAAFRITGAALCCSTYIFIAACARRFNDRGKSSWWVFSGFLPVVGPISNLIELGFLRGTPGRNRFGPPYRNRPAGVDAVFGEEALEVAREQGRMSGVAAVLTAWLATLACIAATLFLLFYQRRS